MQDLLFKDRLADWSAATVMKIIRCPRRTAFAWKQGTKIPHDWVQRLVLDRLKRVKPDR